MLSPFSFDYHRKMYIFGRLMEYESQKDKKNLWGGEKAFLIWSGSQHHQNVGSEVGKDHLKNALSFCLEKGYLGEEERAAYVRSGRHIVESLPTHGMAKLERYADEKNPRIKINENGILAGQILIETNNLRNVSWYKLLYRLSKIKWEVVLSLVAILISALSYSQGKSALKIANEANDISEKATSLQAEGLTFSKDERSQKYVEDVFDFLYQDESNLVITTALRANKPVKDFGKLLGVIDYLESAGSAFCQGTVWKWHLNVTLKNTLEDVCENDQILSEFVGKKNGLAMLCREFFPESKFARTLQTYNMSTCIFHDSSELKSLIQGQ